MCIFSLNSFEASLDFLMATLFYYKYYNKQIIVSLTLSERGNKQKCAETKNFVQGGPALSTYFF